MPDIKKLKQQSNKAFNKIKDAAKNENAGSGFGDDRFWKPYFDKEKGTGKAVVRFLPAPTGEDLPWVKMFTHGFKGPTGKWYIENSLTTLGQSDPVSDMNSRLWNSGVDSDKQVARSMKRRISYYSNVLVVKDPANRENEGKVFLYRYGQKIYDMLEEAMMPEFDEEEAINPFDFWKGADFEIRMRIVNDFRNYDKSFFHDNEELFDGDEDKLQEVWEKCYSLKQFLEPENFKSYDQLKTRLFEVLGPTVGSGVPTVEGWDEEASSAKPPKRTKKVAKEEDDDDVPFDKDDGDSSDSSDDDEGLIDATDDASSGEEDEDLDFFNDIGDDD